MIYKFFEELVPSVNLFWKTQNFKKHQLLNQKSHDTCLLHDHGIIWKIFIKKGEKCFWLLTQDQKQWLACIFYTEVLNASAKATCIQNASVSFTSIAWRRETRNNFPESKLIANKGKAEACFSLSRWDVWFSFSGDSRGFVSCIVTWNCRFDSKQVLFFSNS